MSSEDPTLERHFKGHRNVVTALAFNPLLKQLASGSLDSTLMIWNFNTNERAYRFQGHTDAITDVNFAPNNNLVASSSMDRTVRLWTPTVSIVIPIVRLDCEIL